MVAFEDGQRAAFDLVIAADGVHSALRSAAVPMIRETYTGVVLVAFTMPTRNLTQPSRVTEIWDARGQVGLYPFGEETAVDCAFPYPLSAQPDYAAIAAHARDILNRFSSPVAQTIVAQMPPSQELFISFIHNTRGEQWSAGRVIAIGDAAHAILPTAGMGASLALGDAEALGRAIAEEGTLEAISARLLRERQPVADRVQQEGIFLKNMMLLRQPWALLRNWVLRVLPTAIYTQRLVSTAP